MSATCPNGHVSTATDYCDTCGAPIDESAVASEVGAAAAPDPDPAASAGGPAAGAAGGPAAGAAGGPAAGAAAGAAAAEEAAAGSAGESAAGSPPTAGLCPNCGTQSSPDALFCEACGYDFTTGAMPRSAGAATAGSLSPVPPAIPLEWVAEVWVDPQWYAEQEAEDPCPSPGLPVVVPLTVQSALIGRVSTSRNIHPDIDCATDSAVSRRHAQLTTDGTRWFVEDLQSSNGTFVGPASGPLPDDPIPVGPKTELHDGDRLYVGAWTRIVVRRATEDEKAGTV